MLHLGPAKRAFTRFPLCGSYTVRRVTTNNTKPQQPQYRIGFFGSDAFSVPAFEALVQSEHVSGLGLICPQPKPKGRKRVVAASPLQTLASEHNIETTLVASKMDFKMNEFDESVLRGKFDLGVVVSFGYFIPQRVLKCFPQGVINIHPSLLPQYRGATPIYGALRDTLDTTGVSVQEVSPAQIDTGSVFLQEKVAIEPFDTYPELHDRLARKGAALLADTVLPELATLRAKPKLFQPERESSFVGKVTSQHGLLTPESQPAVEIHSQWRALKGNVSVYLEAQNNPAGKRLTLTELTLPFQPLPAASGELPGQLVVCKGSKALQLVCADGQKLEVLRVRVESKKECRAMDFANGYMR